MTAPSRFSWPFTSRRPFTTIASVAVYVKFDSTRTPWNASPEERIEPAPLPAMFPKATVETVPERKVAVAPFVQLPAIRSVPS